MNRHIVVVVYLVAIAVSSAGAQQATETAPERIRALEESVSRLKEQVGILQVQLAELARRIESKRTIDEQRTVGRKLNVAGAPYRGTPTAPVILIEFADFVSVLPSTRESDSSHAAPRLRRYG
jgi:hypothetical protein